MSATAWPAPLPLPGAVHCVRTLKRPLFKQSVVALATHGAASAAGDGSDRSVRPAAARTTEGRESVRAALPPPPGAVAAANAFVSWIGWNATPWGLTYVRVAPDCVSVTVMTTPTLVNPPAKTQKRELNPQPVTALTTISALLGLKNQK